MYEECAPWVWYLAIDLQLFLLTPPIIYAYCRKRVLSYAICCLLVLINVV